MRGSVYCVEKPYSGPHWVAKSAAAQVQNLPRMYFSTADEGSSGSNE